ncbi:MAG TPA: PEP/pyruvate-binding domain-containing protein [Gemmataceae bacterium]|nr:PEP/pyruvate-binding domain-containing protein [Gemmataceae bacterium]
MGTAPANPFVLQLDSPEATLAQVGGKGASLARLAAAGMPVPPGFQITTHAYGRFVDENQLANPILAAAAQARADDPATLDRASAQIQTLFAQGTMPSDLAALIRQAYSDLGNGDPAVAVRSSATAEDLPELSFAGQQETYLNVRDGDRVLAAVQRCWASLWTARAIGYRARQGFPADEVRLAVVVQQLVPAEVAGILFTANPLTGARDEMMVNASWGLGEAIVGGLVTPDTLLVNKTTGIVTSQEIAEKEVMTVPSLDGTGEEPVPTGKRRQAALQPQQAAELARLGAQIEQLYGRPMDIEWALHRGRFFILQARPITALPELGATLNWELPRGVRCCARANVIELMPDPLSPLFATLALPLWDEELRELLRFLGMASVMPRPALFTINDYAYFDYSGVTGTRMLLVLPRLILLVPRLIALYIRGRARWVDEARPRYINAVAEWAGRDLSAASTAQLLAGARAIVRAAASHYVAIESGILPLARMNESLFTNVHNRLFRRKGGPAGLTFLLGFDSTPIRAEKSLYDLAMWAHTQPGLADYLTRATGAEIAAAYPSDAGPVDGVEGWNEFRRRFADHLDRFGHAIYDLDFAKSLAADDPAPLIAALKCFLAGQARNPHQRQAEAAAVRERATQALRARLKGMRWWLFRSLLQAAQRYAPLREDALADVGLGWPLLRRLLREVGRRLVAAGTLAERDEVFWLKWDEVETAAAALDAGTPGLDYRRAVAERRALWERERMATPPVVLPIRGARFFGIDLNRLLPALTDQAAGATIKGIGTSPGRVTGAARVIHGPAEFNQMRQGDILVAKITTPAWTPLFALASGVVTDVGGPLSHGSIVAREYHIPAVLGTGVATERIRSGQQITVDGDGGVVALGR